MAMPFRLILAMAASWSATAASPQQPLLRGASGAGNSSLTSLQSLSAAPSALSHIVWSPLISYCLSIDGNQIGNGVKVQLWQCDQTWRSSGQNFYLDLEGRIRMHQNPEYCVVVDGDSFRNGAKIQLWRCSEDNQNQVWSFRFQGQIQSRALTPMCLVIDGNKAFNGAKIQLWSCSDAQASDRTQDWMQLALGAGGRVAYAVPDEDKACASPFAPVSESAAACATAAEAMQPGQGCYSQPWAEVVEQQDDQSRPQGCYFYAACQGGCSLDFNPMGAGASCPTRGDCMSIDVLCQLQLP